MKNMNKLIENRDMMQENMAKVKKILEVELSGSTKKEVMMLIDENQMLMRDNIGMQEEKINKMKNKKVMRKNKREMINDEYEDMYK